MVPRSCCSGDVQDEQPTPDDRNAPDTRAPRGPRVVLVIAVALGLLLAAGVATVGVIGSQMRSGQEQAAPKTSDSKAQQARRTGPLALPPVPAPDAASRECDAVLSALPRELEIDGDPVGRRELVQPAPEAVVAWGDAHHDPVTLRCGITAPAELKPTSRLVVISGVSWLPISRADKTTWLAVDRPVHVALTASRSAGSAPVQTVSRILADTLPKRDPFP